MQTTGLTFLTPTEVTNLDGELRWITNSQFGYYELYEYAMQGKLFTKVSGSVARIDSRITLQQLVEYNLYCLWK